MSAGWIRCANDIGDHRKMLEVSDELYLPCLGMWLVATGWCDRHLTDGAISRRALQRIVGGEWECVAEELVRVGMFDRDGDGYAIHDYLDWQESAEVQRARSDAQREKARARWSKRGNADGNAGCNAAGNADGNADKTDKTDKTDKREDMRADDGIEQAPPSYANSLPECMTRLVDREGTPAATDIYRAFAERFPSHAPTDWGEFCAAFHDGCLHGCDGNRAQAVWCAEHIIGNDNYGGKLAQHASPKGWRSSKLLARSLREDRREVPPPRKERR